MPTFLNRIAIITSTFGCGDADDNGQGGDDYDNDDDHNAASKSSFVNYNPN